MPRTSGTHTNGMLTRKAAAAIKKGQLLKTNTDGSVTPCAAATDVALFIAHDDADAGNNVAVATLGNTPGTFLVLLTAAATTGAAINVLGGIAAAGALAVGRALEPGAIGDLVECAHFATRAV